MSAALALFVPHAPPGSAWAVRRAHTIVETYGTQREAIDGACALAADLRLRMGGDVRIEVQDAGGGWRVFATVNDHRSARVRRDVSQNSNDAMRRR
jgi:hypothetical protein